MLFLCKEIIICLYLTKKVIIILKYRGRLMKIKTLLFLGIFAIAILPANAELTTSDVRSRDYLMNHGHSSATADIVQMQND